MPTQPPCTVRPMQAADLAACAAIEQSSADAWSLDALSDELCAQASGGAQRLFVATQGSAIAGLAIWQLAAGEASLYTLTVAPTARRQGVGRRLLGSSMQALLHEGATAYFLEVRAGNAAAIALYQGAGFATVGRRKHFYQNPTEDALVMNCLANGQADVNNSGKGGD